MGDAEIIELKPEVVIKLDGNRLEPRVMQDVQGIRVFQSRRKASAFEIVLQDHEAKWSDADLFFAGREIEIEMGWVGNLTPLFKGEITAWRTELERDGNSALVVRGMDKSHRLMRGTKTRTYKDMTSPQIAQQIAGEYGLTAKVASGGARFKFRIQSNETDYAFLSRLASTDGYELYVDGDELHFEEPQLSSKESSAVELEYGKNIKSFLPFADFRIPVMEVETRAWDSAKQQDISGKARVGAQIMTLSGGKHGAEVAKAAFGEAKRQLAGIPPENKEQAERMARAALTQWGMSFLTGELTVRGNPNIRAGEVVKISKCGQWFSGTYYVVDANHFYDPGGYETIAFLARDKWGEKSDADLAEEERQRAKTAEKEAAGEEGKVIFQQFVDGEGKPIPKVQWEVVDEGKKRRVATGTTGEDGIVQTRVVGDGPFKVKATGIQGLTPSGGTVSGRIVVDGVPIPGAPFKLRKDSEDAEPITDATLKGVTQNEFKDGFWRTDKEGWYRFDEMPGGRYFIEVVDAEGGAEVDELDGDEVDTTMADEDTSLALEETDPESGRDLEDELEERIDVVGAFKTGDRPLAFVPFKLHRGSPDGELITPENLAPGETELNFVDGAWTTDGDGKYLFKGMPGGEYFIELVEEDEGPAGPVDLKGRFASGGEPTGQVAFRLHKDKPDGPLVTMDNLAPGETGLQFRDGKWWTDSQGRYEFKKMPPAEYYLELVDELEDDGETTPGGNDGGWEPPG